MGIKRITFNYFVKHWIFSAFISVVPSIIGLGISIWLNQNMPFLLKIIITILLLLCGSFTTAKFYFENINKRKRDIADTYYLKIMDNTISAIKEEANCMIDGLNQADYESIVQQPINPFNNPKSSLSPDKRIKNMMKDTMHILSENFAVDNDDIAVSLYYFNTNKEWKIFCQDGAKCRDLSPNKIAYDEESTFFQVKEKGGGVYFSEKTNAEYYIKTESERKKGMKGSIYCSNISIYSEDFTLIQPLVLCIATYSNTICKDYDDGTRAKALKLFDKLGQSIQCEFAHILLNCHMGLRQKIK